MSTRSARRIALDRRRPCPSPGGPYGCDPPVQQRLERLGSPHRLDCPDPGGLRSPFRPGASRSPLPEMPARARRRPRDRGRRRNPRTGTCTTASSVCRVVETRMRDATVVERLRDRRGRSRSCPPVEHARQEHARPGQIRRLVQAPGADRYRDRHGRRERGGLDDCRRAVRQDAADWREAASGPSRSRRRRTGSNQPTVRVSRPRRRRAASCTCSDVTASRRGRSSSKNPGPCHGFEVAELMRDVRDAVGLEHQAGAQLPLGPLDLGRGPGPMLLTRPRSASRAADSSVWRRPRLPSRSARWCRGTDSAVGSRATATRRCEAALDERHVEPRPPLRRRAAKARPEIGALRAGQRRVEHQHREEVRISRRRRVPREFQISRRPSRSSSDAPFADLRRLGGPTARGRGPQAGIARNAPARPRSTSSASTSPTTTSVALSGT